MYKASRLTWISDVRLQLWRARSRHGLLAGGLPSVYAVVGSRGDKRSFVARPRLALVGELPNVRL